MQGAPKRSVRCLWRRLACWVGLVSLLSTNLRSQETAPTEYQVKAVWLLNFARFVEWPTNTFPHDASPFVVGVLGKDPFGKDLERAFERKTFRGRPFTFKRISSESERYGCHILFVPSSERRRFREGADKLRRAPVLTVGEGENFLEDGGIINFTLKDNSVRFEIDVKAAQAAKLKLNANLLKVAATVRGKYD
jgi:hypothetical protein